ncbi:N-acetylmuramoyl-L-alanine amidase [Priestia aryabhattai]|uniref:N-acetylmuramoyl-L-alanine amidase n=1 Tax=Priestia aryabhattai TaxID=412384 RepID=UPI001EB0B5FB|nr:N-acetylmuramoyl-L-alanine amidase [Priestia aryabhattai]MBY0094953.1 N-acetylmuramoyl-L-alanine amidase [Priestia aryabhattai]MBY0105606.1 N-acetylmuramoyl-L-alanine amidase [Priestia aryabhattai]
MVKKIYLDEGHGESKDSGAVNAKEGLMEAQLNLKLSNYAIAYLKANYTGFEINRTRSDRTFAELKARANKANAWGADVFVSIHVNAGGGTGYESFIYNKSTSTKTKQLQKCINDKAMATAKKYGLGAHGNNPNKSDNLSVLRNTNMPACLTEICYIDSKDCELLKNEAFLKDMAEAYAEGIADFLCLEKQSKLKETEPKKETVQQVKAPAKSEDKAIGTVKVLVDDLVYYNKKDWNAKAGKTKKGDVFTVVEKVKVNTAYMYRLVSGTYITAATKYVKFKSK